MNTKKVCRECRSLIFSEIRLEEKNRFNQFLDIIIEKTQQNFPEVNKAYIELKEKNDISNATDYLELKSKIADLKNELLKISKFDNNSILKNASISKLIPIYDELLKDNAYPTSKTIYTIRSYEDKLNLPVERRSLELLPLFRNLIKYKFYTLAKEYAEMMEINDIVFVLEPHQRESFGKRDYKAAFKIFELAKWNDGRRYFRMKNLLPKVEKTFEKNLYFAIQNELDTQQITVAKELVSKMAEGKLKTKALKKIERAEKVKIVGIKILTSFWYTSRNLFNPFKFIVVF